jgi:putative ABC transport system permease protein
MLLVGFRDLQWRRRRFVIGIVATALVFSLTLVLGGITAFFHNETRRTVRALDVDAWIVPKAVAGPFTSTQFLPETQVNDVRRLPGVRDAAPLVLFRQTVRLPRVEDLNIIGAQPGGLGAPRVAKGHAPRASGEIAVDSSLDKSLGSVLHIVNRDFRIVGITHGLTYLGGTPVAFMPLSDAQHLLFAGSRLASTIVTRGTPTRAPAGMQVMGNTAVRSDLYRPIGVASQTIGLIDVLLWLIAAGIVAAILYMSALERVKDFAVMKATGASNWFVVAGLSSQAIVLSITSAIAAVLIAWVLVPIMPITVEIPSSSYLVLLVTAVAVGIVGSLAGLRRALSVDPALAFGG